ncbi:MAG: NADH:ubiquinone oxidoreductase [Thermoplasmatales archaeon]|nr:NADH:ubiquinone oxidoreductase [Thermoplasmatales archaeon]
MKSKNWFLKGVNRGIETERFPLSPPDEVAAWSGGIAGKGNANCPTDAITNNKWDAEKCIYCRRCFPNYKPTGNLARTEPKKSHGQFKKSFFIYPFDFGTCGACNVELRALSYPQYDLNRLGIFFTNTPRHADAIVIMGVFTPKMRDAFLLAYDAMPEPKTVIALGVCAITGGVIGKNPDHVSVIDIPGCPPNPYAILDALIRVRK